MQKIQDNNSLGDADWRILNLYSNEGCNETLNTLRYEFSLHDFLMLEEYCDILWTIKEEVKKANEPIKKGR